MSSIFDLKNGFLPSTDPIEGLPSACKQWEDLSIDLPKLLTSTYTRSKIDALAPFPIESLQSSQEHERAMLILSYLGHAYVWCDAKKSRPKLACEFRKKLV